MKKGIVVVIDDQPRAIRYYKKALEAADYDVSLLNSAADAWDYFVTAHPDVCAIILDIIMPPPKQLSGDHHSGTWTGVYVYEHIARLLALQKLPNNPMPIAILTQSTDKEMFDALQRIQAEVRPLEKFQAWSKQGLDPGDFIAQFEEWLSAVKQVYA